MKYKKSNKKLCSHYFLSSGKNGTFICFLWYDSTRRFMTKLFGLVVKSLVELKGGTHKQIHKGFYEKYEEECSVFTCDIKKNNSHLFPLFSHFRWETILSFLRDVWVKIYQFHDAYRNDLWFVPTRVHFFPTFPLFF